MDVMRLLRAAGDAVLGWSSGDARLTYVSCIKHINEPIIWMSGVYPHVTSQYLLNLVTFEVLYVLLMISHTEY